jgi:DNA polymerase
MACQVPAYAFNRAINLPNALIGGVRQVKTRGMEIGTNPDYHKAFSAALDWWRDAGVGNAFEDQPRSWLSPPAVPSKPHPIPSLSRTPVVADEPPAPPLPMPADLPADLESFRSWWLSFPALDGGRIQGRVAPRGGINPELMIIAAMPERDDRESVLSGTEGKLLDLFLAQAGIAQDAVYCASALPSHSPAADWTADTIEMLGQALRHHVLLTQPKRLMVIGLNLLPLLQHDSTHLPAVSGIFNHEGMTVPMLAVRRIPALASQPRWKCILWQAWLDWTA